MSTRGAIARAVGDANFAGRYHHWDSYPTALGATLWAMYHGPFGGDIERMRAFLIDFHPAGWSTINSRSFDEAPGYGGKGCECYCHGERSEDANLVTAANAANIGCEYVYLLEAEELVVLSSYNPESGSKMIGMFGSGNPDATWSVIGRARWDGPEPNWDAIEEAA